MKTEAVMCMALTSTKPSLTPLSRRQSSTSRVMLRNARRPGTSNHNSLRKDFTLPLSLLCGGLAHGLLAIGSRQAKGFQVGRPVEAPAAELSNGSAAEDPGCVSPSPTTGLPASAGPRPRAGRFLTAKWVNSTVRHIREPGVRQPGDRPCSETPCDFRR